MAKFTYPAPAMLLLQEGGVYQPEETQTSDAAHHARTVAAMLLECLHASAMQDPLAMNLSVDKLLTRHYEEEAKALATTWKWQHRLSRLRELESEAH